MRNKNFSPFSFILYFFCFAIFAGAQSPDFIFLFIGDGMGEMQIIAAEEVKKINGEGLIFTKFPVKGWQKTSSANQTITDSAAAATAMACGRKTNNGILGITPDGKELLSIAQIAHRNSWKIGILTSVSLDHATPAGFYAKSKGRNEYPEIARQLSLSEFEFFGGGGLQGQKAKEGEKDRLQLAIEKGYKIVRTRELLDKIQSNEKVFAFNHRLRSGASLPWALDYEEDDIKLSEFTRAAIKNLEDKKFFIMVEGGKIDWACHSNDLSSAAAEILHFDDAVREAYSFYKKYPERTLIVVTADHETGGLKKSNQQNPIFIISKKISSEKLSSTLKDFQRESKKFEDILEYLKSQISFELTQDEINKLKKAWEDFLSGKENKSLYGKENPVASTLNKIIALRSGFEFSSPNHTASDVPVFAIGIGANEFSGSYENTDIFSKLLSLMKLKLESE
ncbi:MAG TPA: alkaline phosphatase [Victivallales bacterium]|nr:alkaline phosphatase [Victivallales bacterium]HRU00460.1 alkaline phosphatase [Victivallales bacterium]